MCDGATQILFTENDEYTFKLIPPFVKDGINDFIVHQKQSAVNPAATGTGVTAAEKT